MRQSRPNFGKYKTVKARFGHWLSGKSPLKGCVPEERRLLDLLYLLLLPGLFVVYCWCPPTYKTVKATYETVKARFWHI